MPRANDTSPKRKPKKAWRLDDLEDIANSLGLRLHIAIVPNEFAHPWWHDAEKWLAKGRKDADAPR